MFCLFLILGCMFAAYVYIERYPKHHPAIVAFATLLALVVFGYVPADKAFAGLSHRATLTVAFTLFCAQALECAGAIDAIGLLLQKINAKNGKLLMIIHLICTSISAWINNISAMYLTLPIGKRVCRENQVSTNIFVMPLACCALIGGMLTVMGTPPNMIIAERRRQELGIDGGLFYDTPLAIIIATVSLIAIYFLAYRMLEKKSVMYSGHFERERYLYVFEITEDLKVSFEDIFHKGLKNRPTGLAVKQIGSQHIELAAAEDILLHAGDIIVVKCVDEETSKILQEKLKGKILGIETLEEWELLHIIYIDEDSELLDMTAQDESTGSTLDVRFLALASDDGVVRYKNVGSIPFAAGTSYLVLAKHDKIRKYTRKKHLPTEIPEGAYKVELWKIAISAGLFITAILASNFGLISLEIALGITLLGNYAFGILNPKYKIVVEILLMAALVAFMIPIGNTIEDTGAAKILAENILWATTSLPFTTPALSALFGILIASILIANFIDNSASALIMLPIAISAAKTLGVSPDPYFTGIMIGVSTTMILPIGHNCTILAQRECRYSIWDFFRFGGTITLVIVVTTMIGIPMMYKF